MVRITALAHRLTAVVVVTVLSGAVLVAGAAPATAHPNACPRGTPGVTVVVDFGSFGQGVHVRCVPSGGDRAHSLFAAAGFNLSWVTDQPGAVCRVNGYPTDNDACAEMPSGDAYWQLWHASQGASAWTYSQRGVQSLRVPDGGFVSFSWNRGPSIAPSAGPAPRPSPTATANPGGSGSSNEPSSGSGGGSAGSPSIGGGSSGDSTDSPEPSEVESEGSDDAEVDDSSGSEVEAGPAEEPLPEAAVNEPARSLPWWIVAFVLLVIIAATVISTFLRRRAVT